MRFAVLGLAGLSALALAGCGAEPTGFSDEEIVGSGSPITSFRVTPEQRAKTSRILASDRFLASVIDEGGGGGYKIEKYGAVIDRLYRFIGTNVEIRPFKHLAAARHFPTICDAGIGYLRYKVHWRYEGAPTLDIYTNLAENRIDGYEIQQGHRIGPPTEEPEPCVIEQKNNPHGE